jgi:transposase
MSEGCLCGEVHPEIRNPTVLALRCDCGNVMDGDRNAAANIYWYGEDRRNRISDGAGRGEPGVQELAPMPGSEP